MRINGHIDFTCASLFHKILQGGEDDGSVCDKLWKGIMTIARFYQRNNSQLSVLTTVDVECSRNRFAVPRCFVQPASVRAVGRSSQATYILVTAIEQ